MIGSNARAIGRVALVAIVLMGVLAGCKSAFRESVEVVASNLGRNADEVENAFKAKLPGATEAELELSASRTASDTQWIKSLGTRLAVGWEERATLRAVGGATCDLIDVVKDLGDATTTQDVENVIRFHIRKQGLAETDAKVIDVAKGIVEQLKSLNQNGSINSASLLVDLGCLPF